MSDAKKQLAALANQGGFGVVDDADAAPVVRIEPDLNVTAKRLGEIVARLDLFEMNGDQVFFDHAGEMRMMTPRRFATWINDSVVMAAKFDKDSGTAIPGMLGIEAASVVLESENFRRGVRRLNGVNKVRLPVIRDTGELEQLPFGYDDQTGIFTVEYGTVGYDLDIDIAAAKIGLERVFSGFPLTDERSKAVQIAMMCALFCRHLPGGTGLRPGALWLANKPGTGKSVLAKLCLYPVLGSAAAAKMKRNEDLDKELEAFSRAAVPYIFLDNIYGGIESATIDQMLTSEEGTGRAMGGHGVFTAKNTALLLATGNGLELNPDAARRFLVVDLFEKGDPSERKVDAEHVLNDKRMRSEEFRRMILGYLWAIVKNWHETGMKTASVVLPSFENYSWMLGGVIEAAGYFPPFTKAEIPDAISPGEAEIHELCRLVIAEMGEKKTMDFTLEDFARLARSAEIFQRNVGTQTEGKKLAIKEDGIPAAERGFAEDRGYLTPAQRTSWSKRLKKDFGGEKKIDGKVIEFGKRDQARKATFTVTILSE